MNKIYSFTLLLLILFSSQSAFAACTSPAGAASQTRYDFGLNKLYYCNDTDWVEMGGTSIWSSAPDVVICLNFSTPSTKYYYYLITEDAASYTYRYSDSPLEEVIWDISGNFLLDSGSLAHDCGSKTMAQLKAAGRAGYFSVP